MSIALQSGLLAPCAAPTTMLSRLLQNAATMLAEGGASASRRALPAIAGFSTAALRKASAHPSGEPAGASAVGEWMGRMGEGARGAGIVAGLEWGLVKGRVVMWAHVQALIS